VKLETEHWLGPAAWYSSLVLSFSAVLLSSSEAFIFSTIKAGAGERNIFREVSMIIQLSHRYWETSSARDPRQNHDERTSPAKPGKALPTHQERAVRVKVRWNMVFTWQAPMMLMAYSVMGFLIGLLVYVCTPLYDGRAFDAEGKVNDSNIFTRSAYS
jgi:hypothetical protein